MLPNSPRRDPWYRDPSPGPSTFERAYDLYRLISGQCGLLTISLLVSIGPFPSILMWRADYRASLIGPTPTERSKRMAVHIASSHETLAYLSAIPALFWAGTMLLSLYYAWNEDTRLIGLLSLAAGTLIMLFGLLRLGLFLRG